MVQGNDLGIRMKGYEHVTRTKLLPRTPAIVRVDGKAFHSFTRGCTKPFDKNIGNAMDSAAVALMSEVQNARLAYVQSDEISVLMVDFATLYTQPWLGGNIQKMCSVAGSIAAVAFTIAYANHTLDRGGIQMRDIKRAHFDGRVFMLPESEVCNYFLWRMQDATRNAIQMVARAHFSHKECHKLSCDQLQEKLFQERQINFNDTETRWKRGRVIAASGAIDNEIPIFTQDREYIEKFLSTEE